LLALSHRIIVLREGRLSGELAGDAMNEESILQLATPGFYRRANIRSEHGKNEDGKD
jgi:hypothetical protein